MAWWAQCFGPLALYQVAGREMVEEGATSIINKMEAEMVLCIYRELVSRYPHLRTSHQIAIISPYSAQVPPSYQSVGQSNTPFPATWG